MRLWRRDNPVVVEFVVRESAGDFGHEKTGLLDVRHEFFGLRLVDRFFGIVQRCAEVRVYDV